MAQSDVRPTGDQEVVGSTPAGSSNILSWRLIMKYFYSHPLKKDSCQFHVKECAQVLVDSLED